ncbi:hypothetical protein [Bacteroides finegoldii]|uniref:hypothetical protein n=1 Tax=Bacteroides finegoldii TaxID=338188 RepID=UPI00321A37C8
MIVTTDIANIIFKDCKAFGISEMYQRGNIPEGEVKTERIVIYPKAQQPDAYWERGYVEVNLCVPVTKTGKANLIRLNELERNAREMFKDGIVGQYDGSWYRYSSESIGIEEDKELCCYYVNVKLLFETLNVN